LSQQLRLPKTWTEIEDENKELKAALKKLYAWAHQVAEELDHFSDRVNTFMYGQDNGDNGPDIPSQISGYRQLVCDHTEWGKGYMHNTGKEVCKECGIARNIP